MSAEQLIAQWDAAHPFPQTEWRCKGDVCGEVALTQEEYNRVRAAAIVMLTKRAQREAAADAEAQDVETAKAIEKKLADGSALTPAEVRVMQRFVLRRAIRGAGDVSAP